ncbi:MAG: Ig-like domain-containing protein [Deltaproteobacteria bacterium]|nr:Ig-like domain-containing protein [Deltaproteobacteria bacterium]
MSSTSPSSGATGVAINTAITATFSETMDASTITSSTFTVNGISGTVSYSGATASFTPSSSLGYSTTYTATITTGVKDMAGNAMASAYSWSFTTGAAPTYMMGIYVYDVTLNKDFVGATVSISGCTTTSATTQITSSNGGTSFAGIPSGSTCTFTASASGYTAYIYQDGVRADTCTKTNITVNSGCNLFLVKQ